MNYDGRNGRMEHYSDTEQNISPLKKNKVLFSDDPWEISDSHRKKELPPLKDTVSIYRKENPQRQKELIEKWHDNEGKTNTNVTNNESFVLEDSNANVYDDKDPESAQDQTIGYVNNSFMNNNEQINTSPLPNQVDENIIEKSQTPEIIDKSNRKITFMVSEKDSSNSGLSNKPGVVRSSSPTYIRNNNYDNNAGYKDDNNKDYSEETGKTDYRKVALDLASQRSSKNQQKDKRESLPDFVLVYNVHDVNALHKKEREIFEAKIKEEDIEIVYDIVGENMFVQLYPTFERLCQEAEAVALEMPLEGVCLLI